MRYHCSICGQFVKDKFIFGLLHFCLTPEERLMKEHLLMQQQMGPPAHDMLTKLLQQTQDKPK